MKLKCVLIVSLIAAMTWAERETINFNDAWRFARFGTMPDSTEKAEPEGQERIGFDDADWRLLNVPHDWGIEGPFRAELPNRTGKLPWAGIGWYRKAFRSLETDAAKKVFIAERVRPPKSSF